MGGLLRDLVVEKLDAAGRGHEAGDPVDEGRLAGAVRTDEPDELSLLDREIDGIEPARKPPKVTVMSLVCSSALMRRSPRGAAGVSTAVRLRNFLGTMKRNQSSRSPPAMPSGLRIADTMRPSPPSISVKSAENVQGRIQEREEQAAFNEDPADDRAGHARDAAEIREREEQERPEIVEIVGRRVSRLIRNHRATNARDERRDAERQNLCSRHVHARGRGRHARSNGSRASGAPWWIGAGSRRDSTARPRR